VNRKKRRALAKQQKKKGNKDLAEKIMMFDKLPEMCYMCESEFDKTDRKMVSSWNVVVRESQGRVNLYCPTCWEDAQKILAKVIESMQELKDNKEEKCEKD
tara:strand:- start:49 stop:351 length:303 start_codon:yes stop_codon:yes gene_type:complete